MSASGTKPATIFGTEPLSGAERIDLAASGEAAWRARLLAEVTKLCESDPRFLDQLLKQVTPLRGRGRSPRFSPSHQDAIIKGVMDALEGLPSGEIVETLAITLGVSEGHARRHYDKARKRK